MESRKGHTFEGTTGIRAKHSPLPVDYLKMVKDVFTTNFDEGLQAVNAIKPGTEFVASGSIFPDEIVVSLSLVNQHELAATTGYASIDYDPKASAPTIQELLSACVDGLGALYTQILDTENKERIEQIAEASLSAFEGIPFEWAKLAVEKHNVYLKVDKANPNLDQLADDWLAKNDPELAAREREEHTETEKLFVTGPKKKPNGEPVH